VGFSKKSKFFAFSRVKLPSWIRSEVRKERQSVWNRDSAQKVSRVNDHHTEVRHLKYDKRERDLGNTVREVSVSSLVVI